MTVVLRIQTILWVGIVLAAPGCESERARTQPEQVWGKHGIQDGQFIKPRAIAIDAQDRIYVVDMTARIQLFDRAGKHQGVTFHPPDYRNGRPSGLSIARDGNLLVSDSHYNCLRIYSPRGELLRTLGGNSGNAPGQLGYISDAVQDQDGFFYVAEFGENQRISKLDADGQFVKCWGGPGTAPGEFARIRALALGPDGLLYVADACNHRIQVFTRDGGLVRTIGQYGSDKGNLSYPYDLAFGPGPNASLYVVEFGNCRVQKFRPAGESLGVWGGPGREPGRLAEPWGLAVNGSGQVHVLDSGNDRVQRIDF